MYCSNCGEKVNEDARYCIYCGKRIDDNSEIETYPYQKNKCKFLREIRKTIAQMNNVNIDFAECTNKDMCSGTCPVCDHEISELELALKEKILNGEQVFLPDVTVDQKEIIPSYLQMMKAQENERNDIMGMARMISDDIPLAGVPVNQHDEKDIKQNKKNRYPWRK